MKLFEPGRIGKILIKNRIVMAPMHVGGLTEMDGRLSQRCIDYYVARARGGVGLIITTPHSIRREIRSYKMWMTGLSELADATHDYGVKIAVQLAAGQGRNVSADYLRSVGAVAPSALPCFFNPDVLAHELRIEEIQQLVQGFQFAAEIVSSAGVDAIELNCHYGYLADEFLTDLWNKRTDGYGGDLEGRLRFPLEIIQAIKRGAGAEFPLSFRFGLTYYLEGARRVEEGLVIARKVEAAGVHAVHVDAGCYETEYWGIPTVYLKPGCLVNLSEMVKKVVNIPVITVGKLGNPKLAERVILDGKADFIALGRPLLADPEWPHKVKQGKFEDIRPCIGCENCLGRMREGKYISCAVNPTTGMERQLAIRQAERAKSVLVVGGGPGGMEAARIAALRGHKVTLWEQGDALGGNLIPASVPEFKQEYRSLVKYLSTQIEKLGVNIELAKEATVERIQAMKFDVVFIATGSTPIIPDVPGIGKGNVVVAVDLLLGKRDAGQSVIVIGGGLVGCETALYLTQKGKKLTIVETLNDILPDTFRINHTHLQTLLVDANIEILTSTKVLEITDDGIIIADKYGERKIKADTIVLAVGFKPDRSLSETLDGQIPEVDEVGDCIEPRKVINAIWEGFRKARLV
jgi:2-enoate reductase